MIPDTFIDLLIEKRAFAHLGTVMADGSIQITPVWIDYDGTYILVNSAQGRVKDRNMAARPQVGLEISDPDNPYRYLSVRGRVVEITTEGANEHIDKLSFKYTGRERFNGRTDGQVRLIYKIAVESVHTSG